MIYIKSTRQLSNIQINMSKKLKSIKCLKAYKLEHMLDFK